MTGQRIHEHIGNDTKGNTFRDAVGKRHGDDAHVGRNCFRQITEVYLGNRRNHQETNHNQRRRCRKRRNRHKERRQEQGQEEQHRCGDSRQAGTIPQTS